MDVPVARIEVLETSLGQRNNYSKYIGITVFATSIVGATIGAIAYESYEPCSFLCIGPETRSEYTLIGFGIGALVGLPLGVTSPQEWYHLLC